MEMILKEKQLAFHITTACTLNCKLCVNLMPCFKARKNARHIPVEQIKREISAVFEIYDFIEDVTISGGEPLIHPDLLKITEYCMSFEKQFNTLRIFTNGTLMVEPTLLEYVKKWKILGGGTNCKL